MLLVSGTNLYYIDSNFSVSKNNEVFSRPNDKVILTNSFNIAKYKHTNYKNKSLIYEKISCKMLDLDHSFFFQH